MAEFPSNARATPPTAPDEVLTPKEAAELIGVHTSSLGRWADQGKLDCLRTPGGQRRYRRSDVEALARGGRAA